jgi:hypothetical protein
LNEKNGPDLSLQPAERSAIVLKIASNERHTRLNEAETRLLQRLRAGHWTVPELAWLLDHLDLKDAIYAMCEEFFPDSPDFSGKALSPSWFS